MKSSFLKGQYSAILSPCSAHDHPWLDSCERLPGFWLYN